MNQTNSTDPQDRLKPINWKRSERLSLPNPGHHTRVKSLVSHYEKTSYEKLDMSLHNLQSLDDEKRHSNEDLNPVSF